MKNKNLERVFNELDAYRDFCVRFGHVFDERHLYKDQNTPYGDFLKFQKGKRVRDNWKRDSQKFNKS